MNNVFKKSLLVVAICSQGAFASIDVDSAKDDCNSAEGLEGWSVWCGVDTYLGQQEPTAGGPVAGGNDLAGVNVDSDQFGGLIAFNKPGSGGGSGGNSGGGSGGNPGGDPGADPRFNWEGYALMRRESFHPQVNRQGKSKNYLGVLTLQLDPETGSVEGVMTTSLGEKVVINKDSFFDGGGIRTYASGEVEPGDDIKGFKSYFAVNTEDGLFHIFLGAPKSEDESEGDVAAGVNQLSAFERTIIEITSNPEEGGSGVEGLNDNPYYFSSFGRGGILTPTVRMAELSRLGIIASYSGSGRYTKNLSDFGKTDAVMTVNFGTSMWLGSWKQMKLNAVGSVTGNRFTSSSINEGSATGTVQGTFHGPDAGHLSGTVNVQQEKPSGTEHLRGVFEATKEEPK